MKRRFYIFDIDDVLFAKRFAIISIEIREIAPNDTYQFCVKCSVNILISENVLSASSHYFYS